MLMLDTSASLVHFMFLPLLRELDHISNFSWGSAVLACLYRALDHNTKFQQDNIVGDMLLLQCWVWERFTCISPEIQPVTEDEIVAGLALHLSVRWCRQTHFVFHDQTTVVEFRKKFDHIQPKQVHYHQCSTTLFVEISFVFFMFNINLNFCSFYEHHIDNPMLVA